MPPNPPPTPQWRLLARHTRRRLYEAFGSDRYTHFSSADLDRKIARHMNYRGGVFIECGANDGLAQNNSYWFEQFLGWRGILIEAVPEVAAQCRRNRPRATVVNAALVGDAGTTSITVTTGGLMGYVTGHWGDAAQEALHRKNAVACQPQLDGLREIQVPARTLASILDELKPGPIDLFSLDVEGYEPEVLRGLDLDRYRPRFLCIETGNSESTLAHLKGYYEIAEQLTPSDCLYRRIKD